MWRTITSILIPIISLAARLEAVRFGLPFVLGSQLALTSDEANTGPDSPKPEIVEEKEPYSRWRTITNRIVRFPNGREVEFDVVGQAGSNRAVLIFAWDSKTKTVTMIREYMPGSNSYKFGVAAGLVEDKHSLNSEIDGDQFLTAAKFELEEEAQLVGGTWMQLTSDVIMDKYSSTTVRVYLVLDAQQAENPRPLDDEEDIIIFNGMSVEEIMKMVVTGDMNLVGSWASLVAIQKLRELGEIQ